MKNKPLRSIFLRAAENLFVIHTGTMKRPSDAAIYVEEWGWFYSRYCCDHLGALRGANHKASTPELTMFRNIFEKEDECRDGFGWWSDLPNGKMDMESRILALLLCAEMLRR